MKRAIVTGATGAIGTALITELINNNIEVLVLCRENSARSCLIPDSSLVTKCYCELKGLSKLQNDGDEKYDVFYHLAWDGTVGNSRNDFYIQNKNVEYALDALLLAKRFGCKRFIGAGSQAEYGRVEGVLKPETAAFPETGYGMAKLCAGQMTREAAKRLDMEHVWVRILSVYGPNDTPNSMVMSTVEKLKRGITPEFTKGEQLWDYLYSADAARALFLLGERGANGKTYVLGSGMARPLSEYIEEIKNAINPDACIRMGAIPYSDKQVMHLQADITELTKDTGFIPSVNFTDGIKSLL